MVTKKQIRSKNLISSLQEFLVEESANTQQEICRVLRTQGYEVNQTKVSRLLRKLGAVKVKGERGRIVYWLPKEPPPPEISSPIANLVIDVVANETIVIIHTNPGSASLVARLLDYRHRETEILGTIAGDDTILVAPRSIKRVEKTLEEVKTLLLRSRSK